MTREEVEQLEALRENEIKEQYRKHHPKGWKEWKEIEGDFEIFKAGYLANNPQTGNQIISYFKEHNQTLAKVHTDEPIFVLRAQDVSAPRVIMQWIEMNLDIVSEDKLKEAYQTALAMRRYTVRRDPT